jgi:fumarate hydratase class II
MNYRDETDSFGNVKVPEDAYYGPQTQRAVENFPVSGFTLPADFIKALAIIKWGAAEANSSLNLLDPALAETIKQAADEIAAGEHRNQFPVDIFQTGSGTSTNMNVNEVIASRANEILTGKRGGKSPVHPNDHVNMGQSSNDVIPSAVHIAVLTSVNAHLIPSIERLYSSLLKKSEAFAGILKVGRTHLQDAVAMTLGQEFSGYTYQMALAIKRLKSVEPRLYEIALGGTAVGTGLNAHPEFAAKTIQTIAERTKIPFRKTANHFQAQATQDTIVETSGILKTICVGLVKICNDLRWLSSGPRCGIGEITLPALQPGSSIMPGKINPVIPEAVIQVCFQVIGNDLAISFGGQSGNFELNVCLPLIAHNILQSVQLMSNAIHLLAVKCVDGIEANAKTCAQYMEMSLARVTNLVPAIGYDRAADLAKRAFETGESIRQAALREKILSRSQLKHLLDTEKYPG